jgi:hypothetical protein
MSGPLTRLYHQPLPPLPVDQDPSQHVFGILEQVHVGTCHRGASIHLSVQHQHMEQLLSHDCGDLRSAMISLNPQTSLYGPERNHSWENSSPFSHISILKTPISRWLEICWYAGIVYTIDGRHAKIVRFASTRASQGSLNIICNNFFIFARLV